MAKNTNLGSHGQDVPQKPPKTPRFNDVSFVNYQLPDPVKASLKERPFTDSQFNDALLDLIDAGYSVKFKFDGYTGGYQVYLQPVDPKHRNAHMILPGRGSSPSKALKQACFIHYEVTQEVWQEFLERRREEIDD